MFCAVDEPKKIYGPFLFYEETSGSILLQLLSLSGSYETARWNAIPFLNLHFPKAWGGQASQIAWLSVTRPMSPVWLHRG